MAKDKNNTLMIVVAVVVVLALGYLLLGGDEAPEVTPEPAPEPVEPTIPSAPAADDERVVESKTTAKIAPADLPVISPKREESLARGCVDSDGGFNVFEQGSLHDAKGSTKLDQCSRSTIYVNQLYEYHCGEDGGYVRTYYDCENGCVEGACVE